MSDWRKTATPVKSTWRDTAKPVDDGLGVADSPLRQALARDPAEVVTVETPTGPVQMDRSGNVAAAPQSFGEKFSELMRARDAIRGGTDEELNKTALRVASGPGFVDEMAGFQAGARALLGWIASKFTGGTTESPVDAYTRTADETQRRVDSENTGGLSVEVAGYRVPIEKTLGGMVPALVGAPATALGRVALSGVQGLLSGGAHSRGRLLRGEGGDVAAEALKSGGFGVAAGGVGEALSAGARGLQRAVLGEADLATAAGVAKTQAAADKAAGVAKSEVDRNITDMMRQHEKIAQPVAQPELYTPEASSYLRDYAMRPEVVANRSRIALNAPARLEGAMAREPDLAAAAAAARSGASSEAVEAAYRKAYESAPGDLLDRLQGSVGQRAGLAAGGYVAGRGLAALTGGDADRGGMYGAAVGAVPGILQMTRNIAREPRFQDLALRGTAGLLKGQAQAMPTTARAMSTLKPDDESAVNAYLRGAP